VKLVILSGYAQPTSGNLHTYLRYISVLREKGLYRNIFVTSEVRPRKSASILVIPRLNML